MGGLPTIPLDGRLENEWSDILKEHGYCVREIVLPEKSGATLERGFVAEKDDKSLEILFFKRAEDAHAGLVLMSYRSREAQILSKDILALLSACKFFEP